MMTILKNREDISHELEEEQARNGLRKHVSIEIVKEILRAKERGWDRSRISKEYKVDEFVVRKLENYVAIPVDDTNGVVKPPSV